MTVRSLALLALLALAAPPAKADLRRFLLDWSGVPNGNKAVAKGFLALDDDFFLNPGSNAADNDPRFMKDFSVTVSGATNKVHNGTFLASTFSNILLDSGGAGIDLESELVGQPNFINFNVFDGPGSALAPTGVDPNQVRAGGGAGDILNLTSFRPLVASNVRVYKCTLSLSGKYNYCDRDAIAPGVPRWVCKKYSARFESFLILSPQTGRMSIVWLDTKLKRRQLVTNCLAPDLKFFQCKPPTTSMPAGTWELCVPFWFHREDLDIDFANNPNKFDATRCRVACLTGVEGASSFPRPISKVALRDAAVASLTGSFCQVTCYDTLHYAFNDPVKDTLLKWPLSDGGILNPGGGIACIAGTLSCKLDTKLTGIAIENGDSLLAGENAVVADLVAKGFTGTPNIDCGGTAPMLQPVGNERLEPLIP